VSQASARTRVGPALLAETDLAKRRGMKATSVLAGRVDAAGAGVSGSQPTCAVEMADARGAKMRVELRRRRLGRPAGAVQRILGCAVIHITPHMRAWVTVQLMDFRAGIDGLAAACGKRLTADPFIGALFAFGNAPAWQSTSWSTKAGASGSATWVRPVVGGPGGQRPVGGPDGLHPD
jgi:hypothetical protein